MRPLLPDEDQAGQFAELLAGFDEDLATGAASRAGGEPSKTSPLEARLDRARECLRLLEDVWPRSEAGIISDETFEHGFEPTAIPGVDLENGQFGRFRIIRQLGQGGGGTVFLAVDPELGRRIALKVPRPEALISPALRRRFHREARLAAALDHPNIVPVYEAGEVGPICYIASAYCEGPTLSDWLRRRDRPDPPDAAAALVAKLAEAVHHAHQRNVIHRDIKPSNILLVPLPDAPKMGRLLHRDHVPRLTDFGLARAIDDSSGETRNGAILGTPQYMAPEQAGGRSGELGPQTDVYSLGVLLYELITDRPPFLSDSDLSILQLIVSEEPISPRRLRSNVPRDLETITLKCLEKVPRRRYVSAEALALDLRRFLRGEAVIARPISPIARLWLCCRRNPVPSASIALVFGLLLLLLVGSSLAAFLFERMADREKLLLAAEVQARRELERNLYFHRIHRAQQDGKANNLKEAEEELAACPPDLRGWEWHHLRRLGRRPPLTLSGDAGLVNGLAISPDGHRVASVGEDDRVVRTWDMKTGLEAPSLYDLPAGSRCVAFSPDGSRLAAGGKDGTVAIWDVASARKLLTLRSHSEAINKFAYFPDGRRLATASRDGTSRIWDVETGRELLILQGHACAVIGIAIAPVGGRIATAGEDGLVQVWGPECGKPMLTFREHQGRVHGLAFSPDGRYVASAGEDETIRVWDAETGLKFHDLLGHSGLVTSLSFSVDGTRLASSSEDGDVRIWDVETGRERLTLAGHTAAVKDVVFSPDGRRVASAGWDRTVKIWDVAQGHEAVCFAAGHTSAVLELSFSPDGRSIATASRDKTIRIWEAKTGRTLRTLRGSDATVHGVAFSPDGSSIAASGGDGLIKIWDVATGEVLHSLLGGSGSVFRVAYNPDGTRLASTGRDGTVRIWDAKAGRELLVLRGRDKPVHGVAYNDDGSRVASAGEDGLVMLWDARTGQAVATLSGHTGAVVDVAFSADGRRLASASLDRTIRVWDVATGRERLRLVGHTGFVTGVAFSPDDRRIASTGWDGVVRIWDASTGQQAIALGNLGGRVRGIAFSPDGSKVIAGGSDGIVMAWDGSIESSKTE